MEQSSIAVESSCGQTQLERQDTMANGDLKSYLGLLSGFFNEYRTVLRQKSQPPPRLALNYNRAFLVYGWMKIMAQSVDRKKRRTNLN